MNSLLVETAIKKIIINIENLFIFDKMPSNLIINYNRIIFFIFEFGFEYIYLYRIFEKIYLFLLNFF